jgi:hypothetical protein
MSTLPNPLLSLHNSTLNKMAVSSFKAFMSTYKAAQCHNMKTTIWTITTMRNSKLRSWRTWHDTRYSGRDSKHVLECKSAIVKMTSACSVTVQICVCARSLIYITKPTSKVANRMMLLTHKAMSLSLSLSVLHSLRINRFFGQSAPEMIFFSVTSIVSRQAEILAWSTLAECWKWSSTRRKTCRIRNTDSTKIILYWNMNLLPRIYRGGTK